MVSLVSEAAFTLYSQKLIVPAGKVAFVTGGAGTVSMT